MCILLPMSNTPPTAVQTPENLDLRNMVFSEEGPSDAHKKIIDRPLNFISANGSVDLLLNIIDIIPPPPLNDSTETFLEVTDVARLLHNMDPSKLTVPLKYKDPNINVPELFREYTESKYAVIDMEETRKLAEDAETITLQVQYYFNRPSLGAIAQHYSIPLANNFEGARPSGAPSYPCTESVQIGLLSLRVAQQVLRTPAYREDILRFTLAITRRIMRRGHHFYSDVTAALPLAMALFSLTPFYKKARILKNTAVIQAAKKKKEISDVIDPKTTP